MSRLMGTCWAVVALAVGGVACGSQSGRDAPGVESTAPSTPPTASDATVDQGSPGTSTVDEATTGTSTVDQGPAGATDPPAEASSAGQPGVDFGAETLFPLATAPTVCPEVDLGPVVIAEAMDCSNEVLECEPGRSCPFLIDSSVSQTVRAVALGCQMTCGFFNVGFRDGCATTIDVFPPGAPLQPAEACVVENVIGKRWACAPPDGWARVYLGSCTLR